MTHRSTVIVLICAVLLVASMGFAISLGSISIPLKNIPALLFGTEETLRGSWAVIIRQIRLPRVLCAVLVGGMLASGGVAVQGLFRNPLSEPYLLGISAGAVLGATVAVVTGLPRAGAGLGWVGFAAFIGSLGVAFLVYAAAGRHSFRIPASLLLAGLAVNFLCQALTWFLMILSRNQIERIVLWTLGSLSSASWFKVALLAAFSLPVTILIAASGRILDLLSTGYSSAHGLGLNPEKTGMLILALTSLGTAVAVSVAGLIGFIGLMLPHIMRILGGPSHRALVIRSWLGGATLLVLADLGARTLRAPEEIPVGVITALLGAPFFLVLLKRLMKEGRFHV